MRRFSFLSGLGIVLFLLISCTPTATETPDPGALLPTATEKATPTPTTTPAPTATATPVPLAAVVNGEPITMAAFEQQMANYEASMNATGENPASPEGEASLAQAREAVLNWMIEQVLIVQAASQRGIEVTDEDVDAVIQDLIADIGQEAFEERLAREGMTLDEMRAQLRVQLLASRMAEEVVAEVPTQTVHVNARHIVVDTREEAQRLLEQIRAGADFAALARQYSQDAFTRERGGDLGYFPRGILTSSKVEEVAFSLQPGQVSEVIESELGYHIVQVLDRVEEMEVSPENLRLLKDKAARAWLDQLWEEAEIKRYVTFENEE
ncbi:MAG: peptidylprolyl isomerase [Anaerolineae bacterium]